MKLFKRPIGGSSLVLVALSLVIIFLAFLGISYLLEKPPVVKNLKVTNVSDGMATITYLTEEPTTGYVIVSNTDSFNLLSQLSSYKYYDDREDSVARYTHHITVRGLQADSLYYFRISSGLKNVDITYPSIETGSTPDSLRTPDPAYGQFISSEFNSPDLKAYADALVFMSLNNGTEQSALVNAQGGFTLDKTNVLVKDLSGKVTYKEGDEYTVTLVTNTKSSVVTANVGNDQPIRINELKSTSSLDKLINPLDSNLVKTVSACEVGRSYNECCGAGLSRSVTVTACSNNNDSGWSAGSCNQSDSVCGTPSNSSTTCPAGQTFRDGACHDIPATPAPQESNAAASTVNNEAQNQQTTALTCNGGQFKDGDFCHIDHEYNCKGSRDGKGTITSYNRTCVPTSYSKTNTGTGTNTPAAPASIFAPCKDRSYGLWCDGNNLLSCDGKGGGNIQKACGDVGCKKNPNPNPDECNKAAEGSGKKQSDLAKGGCDTLIESGYSCEKVGDADGWTGGSSCNDNSNNINYCCLGGNVLNKGEKKCDVPLRTSTLCVDLRAQGYTCGSASFSSIPAGSNAETCKDSNTGSEGNVHLCCTSTSHWDEPAQKCVANTVLQTPQCSGVTGVSEFEDSFIPNATTCYSETNKPRYYCSPLLVKGTMGGIVGCYSRVSQESTAGLVTQTECGGSAFPTQVDNSEPCRLNGVKDRNFFQCKAGFSQRLNGGVISCPPEVAGNIKNLVASVSAQSVLGTSTDGDTTVKVDDSGVYKINSVDGYTITTTEVKVTKKTDGTAEIKFFNDTNGNGFKDDGEEFITTPLEVKLEKQKDLASYDLVNGWNLIGWTMADSTVKTAMELLNKIANDGGYATQISTYRNGGWVLLSQRAGQKFGKDFDLIPNEGYFVKVLKPVKLDIEGTKVAKDQSMYFYTGWNLIGYRSEININRLQ